MPNSTYSYANSSLNSFDFKFKTSSDDEINLSMYNNKSLEYKKQNGKNTQTSELTLSHKYGYKFEFKNNGLSQQDKLEIAKALEDITPKIDELINNEKQKNTIGSSVLDLFNNLLKQNKADEKTLQSSKNLFDEILKQLQSFSIYA